MAQDRQLDHPTYFHWYISCLEHMLLLPVSMPLCLVPRALVPCVCAYPVPRNMEELPFPRCCACGPRGQAEWDMHPHTHTHNEHSLESNVRAKTAQAGALLGMYLLRVIIYVRRG